MKELLYWFLDYRRVQISEEETPKLGSILAIKISNDLVVNCKVVNIYRGCLTELGTQCVHIDLERLK